MYEDLLCPLPGCFGSLHLVWKMSRPLFAADFSPPGGPETPPLTPDGAYASTWSVDCEAGHTVLVPVDDAEDMHPFEAGDLARLRELLDAMAGAK